jgi:Flp pilus assembly protein TadD
MTERLGRLYEMVAQPALAQAEYEKLARSNWPVYALRGSYLVGKMQLNAGDGNAAFTSFDAVLRSDANDPEAQSLKVVARCFQAKAMAMNGQTAEAEQQLQQMIRDGNPDDQLLFANIYNALGTVFLKKGDDKAAALAFLHTDLLFASQAEAHAEALYHLAGLWPKLGKTEQAYEARENLKTYYRNSIWAQKLGQ